MPTHAVIWIDHKEARVFHVHREATDATTVLAPQHHFHRHPKARGEAEEHPEDAHRFFGEAARTLDGVDSKVVGVESADHPRMERSSLARGTASWRAIEWASATR
jgi:hypothetical protein